MKPKIRMNGILWGLSIELVAAAVVILLIVTLSCGVMTPVPLGDLPTNTGAIKAHTQIANEMSMVVCNSGGLNVRKSPAGDHAGKWKNDGDIVTALLPATVTPDMGLWYELTEGGWVNGMFLCKEEK